MQPHAVARAAALVSDARLARRSFTPLPADCRPVSEADGYQVQEAAHRLLAQRWGPVVAWKIGCTTGTAQRFLGTDHPCAGGVPASMTYHGHGTFDLATHQRLGIECEIAVVLGRDLGTGRAPMTVRQVAEAVAGCAMAIEIIDNRYGDPVAVGLPSLIADDLFASGCVIGPTTWHAPHRLGDVTGRIEIDGVAAGDGTGRDILGDPLRALVWLDRSLRQRGLIAHAGQSALLGTITAPVWLDAPAEITVRGTLGEVRASVR